MPTKAKHHCASPLGEATREQTSCGGFIIQLAKPWEGAQTTP